jgi:hypothetical protein
MHDVCVAVLDGPVDLTHPCLAGADLTVIDTLVRPDAGDGPMSLHGTHVASLIFGQPGSAVEGIAPGVRGLIVPVFQDDGLRLSQLDLARAIEVAVREGADIISVSGGERTPTGEPDLLLANALRLCAMHDVLVVAATGNDGEPVVQAPAADPAVLAVGAATADGIPLPTNSWGAAYRRNGVLAPGYEIEGARPGGGTVALTGSSFATPVVAGVAALLLAEARRAGLARTPASIRDLFLTTATRPVSLEDPERGRYLAGVLDARSAFTHLRESEMTMDHVETTAPAGFATTAAGGVVAAAAEPAAVPPPALPAVAPPAVAPPVAMPAAPVAAPVAQAPVAGGVTPACADSADGSCGCRTTAPVVATPVSYVYSIGTIGWDFGSEARRDGFIQQMDLAEMGGHLSPGNPYNPIQLRAYLADNPWASDKLIWTCNLDGRLPIYALEAETPYGMTWGGPRPSNGDGDNGGDGFGYPPVSVVHKTLRDAIVGQSLLQSDPNYVARVSVPGMLTNRTVRLFSGQVVPVVVVHAQGLYTWNESILLDNLVEMINSDYHARDAAPPDEETVRLLVRAFLDKVYYQFRNLGQSGPDRALNYAATNAFELTRELAKGFLSARLSPRRRDEEAVLYALDDITVTKSRYARPEAEAYDVTITYFDPENERRSRVAYLQTFDVSTSPPVSLSPPHHFLIGN